MLPTVFLTLLSLLLAVVLALLGLGSPAVIAHLAFAVGIVPLIFAAMLHFVPVLTRSAGPSLALRRLPRFAQLAGVGLLPILLGWLPLSALLLPAAVDLVLAAILLRWMVGRARAALGPPHPGWRWYGGALVCLMLGLACVVGMVLWPEQWPSWRLVHLHLNTLGLVGLAALGTLPLLLPTALGQMDGAAAHWLRRHFWPAWSALGVIALGLGLYRPLSWLGGTMFCLVWASLLAHWWRAPYRALIGRDGAALVLLAASLGWLLVLAAGLGHAVLDWPARPAIAAWGAAGLLPLVSGALSHLLPVWRWPGPRQPAHAMMRARLVAGGAGRAILFLAAGLAFLAEARALGAGLGGLALGHFAINVFRAMRISRSTR
jgi:hypothetical protein